MVGLTAFSKLHKSPLCQNTVRLWWTSIKFKKKLKMDFIKVFPWRCWKTQHFQGTCHVECSRSPFIDVNQNQLNCDIKLHDFVGVIEKRCNNLLQYQKTKISPFTYHFMMHDIIEKKLKTMSSFFYEFWLK